MKIISIFNSNELNAGPKAQIDVIKILMENYKDSMEAYYLDLKGNYTNFNFINRIISNVKKITYIRRLNKDSQMKIFQYPMIRNIKVLNSINKENIIVFIHDLMGIRYCDKNIECEELDFLSKCHSIVVHNDIMKNYLIRNGIEERKVYSLELFDYLTEEKEQEKERDKEINSLKVVYAGNLSKDKSLFLHELDTKKLKFEFNLYGVGIESDISNKMKYKGAFKPEELPSMLEGNLGLVWDGKFDDSDESDAIKNYTKYNNPHKLSCYIAAGLPVIVWEKSAISKFINENNIGYTIKDIYDINELDFNDYSEKIENVRKLSEKVKNGYFTKSVIEKILSEMEER